MSRGFGVTVAELREAVDEFSFDGSRPLAVRSVISPGGGRQAMRLSTVRCSASVLHSAGYIIETLSTTKKRGGVVPRCGRSDPHQTRHGYHGNQC